MKNVRIITRIEQRVPGRVFTRTLATPVKVLTKPALKARINH